MSRLALHYIERGHSIFDTVCGRRATQTCVTREPKQVTCKLCQRWLDS